MSQPNEEGLSSPTPSPPPKKKKIKHQPQNINPCDLRKDLIELIQRSERYLLQRMGVEATCSVKKDPSGFRRVQRNTRRALVLFFFFAFALVGPMRFSTSAFLSFRMPTQSILENTFTSILVFKMSGFTNFSLQMGLHLLLLLFMTYQTVTL